MKSLFKYSFFFVFLAVSAYALYFPYTEVRKKSIEMLNSQQMLLAKQASQSISEYFEYYKNLMLLNSRFSVIKDFDHLGKNHLINLYEQYKKEFRAVTVYNDKGIIQFTYPENKNVIGLDISSQPHVAKILKDKKPGVSDVFRAVQGYDAVALSVPIFRDNKFIGVLAILIDFKYIAKKYVESIKIGENGYAWMISKNGVEVYCPVPGHTGNTVYETSSEFPTVISMAEDMMAGKSGTTYYSYNRVKGKDTEIIVKRAVYTPVKILDNMWSIVVATPEDQAYGELSGFYKKWMFFLGAVAAIFIIYIFILLKFSTLETINTQLEKRLAEESEKRQEQQKLMLQKAKFTSVGEMMSTIAHQWRQPLTSISMSVQHVEEQVEEDQLNKEEALSILGDTVNEISFMSSTIDNFRMFFAPDEEAGVVDIRLIINSVKSIFHAQLRALGIDMRCVCINGDKIIEIGSAECAADKGNKLFQVYGYAGELKQVILSIIQNAKDSLEEKLKEKNFEAEINVEVENINNEIIIQIQDNGLGIDDNAMEKLFDPYFSTKSVASGSGLGLYIAKTIVEEHMDGELTAKNLGHGAEFIIKFNMAKD